MTSVDEAMIDVTSSAATERLRDPSFGADDPFVRVAERIRDNVRQKTGCEGLYVLLLIGLTSYLWFVSCVVSIGVGESLLLARIATNKAKPAGSFHLEREDAVVHLSPLALSILPGFGYNTIEKIKAKWGFTTCGEVHDIKDESALQRVLGPGTGSKLWNFVRGIDDRQLKSDEMRKSVSASINVSLQRCMYIDPTHSQHFSMPYDSKTSSKSGPSCLHLARRYLRAWRLTHWSVEPALYL